MWTACFPSRHGTIPNDEVLTLEGEVMEGGWFSSALNPAFGGVF